MKLVAFLLPLLTLAALGCTSTAPPAAEARSSLELVDLTDEFAAFYDETGTLGDRERVAALKARFEPVIPGFYRHERHGFADAERKDAFILNALEAYPAERAAIADMSRRFAFLLAPAQASFEKAFGPMTGFRPIYVVHSLGEFDGGMRTLGGKGYLMFGADMMAKLYADRDIRPFFHHELFHLHHSRTFRDCSKVWCNLWNEGLATYVSHRLNPKATDAELLLTIPEPLRPAVEANRKEAVCTVLAGLESEDRALNRALFSSGRLNERLPPRFGYYLGYLIAAEAGRTRSLQQLAALSAEDARPVVEESLRRLAACSG
jgi:hypothetical protein